MLSARFVAGMFLVGMTVLGASVACGQNYPNKNIRIIAATVGGGGDFTARQIAPAISGPLGQQVLVDNRANGVLAAEAASKAQPDGYTMLLIGGSAWVFPLLQKATYDVARDLVPITVTERSVFIVAVHPSVAANSIKELIGLAKAKPGALNYSSVGIGGSSHLTTELFKSMAGVNIANVPYKGNAQAITAVLGGEVQLTIQDAGLLAPHLKSGKLRALAVTSATPSALSPGLPTVAATLPGYESTGITCVFVPTGTPQAIITRLNQEIVRFLNRPEVKERFLSAGSEIVASTPEQSAATLKADIARWDKVIKDIGIKVE